MSTRERPADRGRRLASGDRTRLGTELRTARSILGWSLQVVGTAAGLSASQVGRIERGTLPSVSLDQAARLGAVVGLDVRTRAYPGPDPMLDAGQSALLARLARELPSTVSMRTEMPLPTQGDQRAWDAVLYGLTVIDGAAASALPTEAESRFIDIQAQTRRIMLKLRDAGMDAVLLLVADTRRNRESIRAAGPSLVGDFPIPVRTALRELRAGRHPGGSAIVVL